MGSNAKRNSDIRAALARAYPGIKMHVTACTPSGRNGYTELAVAWQGGPDRDAVRAVVQQFMYRPVALHRLRTDAEAQAAREEAAAHYQQWVEDAPARAAAEKAAKVANRAAGVAKRAETAARKADTLAKLGAAFPGVAFKITTEARGFFRVSYTGGPAEADVSKLVYGSVTREDSEDERAAALEAQKAARDARESITAELARMGVETSRWDTLESLRDRLAEARAAQAFRATCRNMRQGVSYSHPLGSARAGARQLLLPMILPRSCSCFAKARKYVPAEHN